MASCGASEVGLGLRARFAGVGEAGVRLVVEDVATGDSREIACKYLLGCDGARSGVREALNITLEDLSFDEPWLVVDILVEDDSGLPETNVQNCDQARPSTSVLGPGRLRRREFMVLPGEEIGRASCREGGCV